jgi:hypothetical protein
MAKVIKVKKFDSHSNHKHVKTRTPYPIVEKYEKEFKHKFGKELGTAIDKYMNTVVKQLNLK